MKNNELTIQDCMDKYEREGKAAIINDGKVIGFAEENIPADDR